MFSDLEKEAFQKYSSVAGIDEAGRGAWAGPVTAAIVAAKNDFPTDFKSIRDSKHLSAGQREEIFEWIKENPDLEWGVSFVRPKTIDRINIWQATLKAWRNCLKKIKPDFVFVDGKTGIRGFNHQAIIKGDEKIFLLSLASIVAKVSRDNLMRRLDKKYPQYGFARHKGYGVKYHLETLQKHGECLIHRKSFQPVFANMAFQSKVYHIVRQIPKGQTMTYREVAQAVGNPKSCRAVGNALNRNHNPDIPCHRVICSNGKTGGYNRGGSLKEKLLRREKSDIL